MQLRDSVYHLLDDGDFLRRKNEYELPGLLEVGDSFIHEIHPVAGSDEPVRVFNFVSDVWVDPDGVREEVLRWVR